jgi:TolA-binding protein
LGEILLEDRKFDKAAERFKAFLKRHPDSSLAYRAHFGQGWALENQGNLAGATERYRQVTRETKTATAARAQFQIGQCLVAKKDWKNAIVELLQVPASYSYPEWSSKALLQAAGCFEALEDGDNAKRYYREVAETFPDRDEAKLARDRLQKIEIQ